MRQLDFSLTGAADVINEWAAGATHGAIERVLDSIDAASLLVLVNAAYFHGLWVNPFSRKKTAQRPFTTGAGAVKSVPLMAMSGSFRYAEDHETQAVSLPYQQDRFSLLVVQPRANLPLTAFRDIATPDRVAVIQRSMHYRDGSLALPRVRAAYRVDLRQALREMGMGLAFAPEADFSPAFGGVVPARISQVVHQTMLEIDEQGTKGAATTAMNYALGDDLNPPPPFEMIVDRPFLAVLSDRDSDEILFLGVIGDPTVAT